MLASFGTVIGILIVLCSFVYVAWGVYTQASDFYPEIRERLRHPETREDCIKFMIAREKVLMVTCLLLTVIVAVLLATRLPL